MPFGIGHPHLHINCSLHVWGRVQGSQIFKQNSIISICSKVMAFLVISLSPWSPRCPHGPQIVPIVPMSSSCHPHHPHIIPIAPRRSPCGPHDLWSPWSPLSPWSPPYVVPMVPMVPTSSLLSPHRPCVVPTSSPSSSCHPHVIPIAPRRSHVVPMTCGLHGLCCLRGLHPMLSPWSPRCPHIILVSSLSSPHHLHSPQKVPMWSP